MTTLSARGRALADQPLRPDLELFDRATRNHYHPTDNPAGAIPLCIAENLLSWPELRERLERPLRRGGHFPDWVASYAPTPGHPDCRAAVAGFLERHIAGLPLDPERLALSAGATAVIELTALLLGGVGDVAVFPAPAYQVYGHDIGAKAGLEQDFLHAELSAAALASKRAELGDRFRMLVLTSPNNPTGEIYPRETLREVADWCVANRVHLVVNEIYALSQFTAPAAPPWRSFLPLLERRRSPYLHWWYSFSKDFGVSGLRVGVLYSHSEELLGAYANVNAPHQVSNPTQFLLAELLNDEAWVRQFLARNRERITAAYGRVTAVLDRHGIPYSPARGSLFVWFRLGAGAREQSLGIWRDCFEQTGVLLTAPQGFGQREPGWFRLVYSCVPVDTLDVALARLDDWLANR